MQNYINSMTAESTQLVMYVPRSVIIYKIKRIEKKIREYSDRLATVPADDMEAAADVMKLLKKMNETRNVLNERLGRRFTRK